MIENDKRIKDLEDQNKKLKEALALLLIEVELSDNASNTDYGWPKAVNKARIALGHKLY